MTGTGDSSGEVQLEQPENELESLGSDAVNRAWVKALKGSGALMEEPIGNALWPVGEMATDERRALAQALLRVQERELQGNN